MGFEVFMRLSYSELSEIKQSLDFEQEHLFEISSMIFDLRL